MSASWWMGLAVVATCGAPRVALATELACPLVTDQEPPTLLFAQRAIERNWGPSDDSIYVEHDIPEWRSEGVAMSLSALVPGVGQAYAGETMRGVWFLAAEVAGWLSRGIFRDRGGDLRADAAAFAGDPHDSTSAWSFERWESATSNVAAELRVLYNADREVFYDLIGSDPQYAVGWNDPQDNREHFSALRGLSDDRLRWAHAMEVGLWINHIVSAADALRAARLHNLPYLEKLGTKVKVKGGWRHGEPTWAVALERRF
jgi:hypothetical protein